MTKLKNCPFCNGKPDYAKDIYGLHIVQCSDCGVSFLPSGSYEELKKRWDKRVEKDLSEAHKVFYDTSGVQISTSIAKGIKAVLEL